MTEDTKEERWPYPEACPVGWSSHRESWSLSGEEGLSRKACPVHRMRLRGAQGTTEAGGLQEGGIRDAPGAWSWASSPG